VISSYPKIYTLGHGALKNLLGDEEVIVQEKVDGSQFSFGKDENGVVFMASKGRKFGLGEQDSLFHEAAQQVERVIPLMQPGWTYRGEYLKKPTHNVLRYSRIPQNHIMLFDINTGLEQYMGFSDVFKEAQRLGFETVPTMWVGPGYGISHTRLTEDFLKRTSELGGALIEGVVIKNYTRFGTDGKALMGKFVSEAFKETHRGTWKAENPEKKDIMMKIIDTYRNPVRWQKAVQHLRERGESVEGPQAIGPLIREVISDVQEECANEIKDMLWDWARKDIARGVTRGLPEWFKEELAKQQFGETSEVSTPVDTVNVEA
jgi:hypothetical protein